MAVDRMISPASLAARMDDVTINMLAIWRHQKTGPAYIKRGRRIWYLESDVAAWAKAQRVATTDKVSA